ncbi:MAG: hypothetical protein K8F62_03905, partial [Pseudorhodoplanes sp.]|nr:hypothetical protein [Pseudorhodoplanes sp.]
MVTDGAVRDADEIRELGFPVIAAAITPTNGARRWRLVEADRPVTLPGHERGVVTVSPGDFVLADGDGVVVIPLQHAGQVIADAEELQRIEREIGKGLRAGGQRNELLKDKPRFAHIRSC